MPFALRYAARSDVGLVRSDNQDSGYAGPHLLVIADGVGGHAGGDVASSTVDRRARRGSTTRRSAADDAQPALLEPHPRAPTTEIARPGATPTPSLDGMGTTADRHAARRRQARAGPHRRLPRYLLRDGSVTQITKDHTFVQSLIDEGRITEDEAQPTRSAP